MRNHQNAPSLKTAERAAEIWKEMLRAPKFDNGDSSFSGGMASALASMIPTNTTDELLDAFAEDLVKRIMMPSEEYPDYFSNLMLNVDYGPCRALQASADAVGLKAEFPWKTMVHVFNDFVSVTAGYAAETVYHYALADGRWLVTALMGADIEMIKDHVTTGAPLSFRIDQP